MWVLSAYPMTGSILGAGDTTVNKTDKNPCLHEADILLQEMDNLRVNI